MSENEKLKAMLLGLLNELDPGKVVFEYMGIVDRASESSKIDIWEWWHDEGRISEKTLMLKAMLTPKVDK